MAGPALTGDANPLWNPNFALLKFTFDQAITSTTGTDGVNLTDAAGLLWTGPVSGADGAGTITLARNYAGTPGTAGTVTIDAAVFTGSGGDNLEIADHAFDLANDHLVPYSRTDLNTVYTALATVFSAGDFSDFTVNQKADLLTLIDRLLKPTGTVNGQANGKLLTAPIAVTQANALIAQIDKFLLSSRDAEAVRELQRATADLRAAMPKGGQTFPFAISSTGT